MVVVTIATVTINPTLGVGSQCSLSKEDACGVDFLAPIIGDSLVLFLLVEGESLCAMLNCLTGE